MTFVIGDIHGGYRALAQVLQNAPVHATDKLIFLGDYVDGWSESVQVVETLIELSKNFSCIFLRGNHDAMAQQWLESGEASEKWIQNGGQSTIDSYMNASFDIKEKHVAFFRNLRNYFIDDRNRLFVHAGFTSPNGVQSEPDDWNFCSDRTLWRTAVAIQEKFSTGIEAPARLNCYSEIFIGHTPTINLYSYVPMKAMNVLNVDTGAAFYGKLSLLDVDSRVFWQSDALPVLYPDEKGRNKW